MFYFIKVSGKSSFSNSNISAAKKLIKLINEIKQQDPEKANNNIDSVFVLLKINSGSLESTINNPNLIAEIITVKGDMYLKFGLMDSALRYLKRASAIYYKTDKKMNRKFIDKR